MTGKFEKCGKTELCTCGLYLRVNDTSPSYAFIDKCSRDPFNNDKFKYYDDSLNMESLLNDDHPLISCDSYVDYINEIDWENIALDRIFFKCVQLKSKSNKINTYVVKYEFYLNISHFKILIIKF